MSWFSFMKDEQYLAQVGHFLGGAALILTAALFSAARCANSWTPILITLAVGIVLASLKEFVFDIWVEKDGWSNSIMDWTFYLLGGAAGVGIVGIAQAIAVGCA